MMKFHHWGLLILAWCTGIAILVLLRYQIPLLLSVTIYAVLSALVIHYFEHRELHFMHKHTRVLGLVEEVIIHHGASKKKSYKNDEYHIKILYSYGDTAGENNYVLMAEDYKKLQGRIGHLHGMPVNILVGEETQPDIEYLKRFLV